MAKGDKRSYRAATFRLPPDVLDMLERASRATGVPKGTLVERALKDWLARTDVLKGGPGDAEYIGAEQPQHG